MRRWIGLPIQLKSMAGEGPGRASLAPRVSTLLRAVQRGDYGVLTNLLGTSNGCELLWSLSFVGAVCPSVITTSGCVYLVVHVGLPPLFLFGTD